MEPVYAAPHERLLASPSVLEADPLAVVDDVLGSLVGSLGLGCAWPSVGSLLGSLVGSLGGTGERSAITVGSGGTGMSAGMCSCVSGASGGGCIVGGSSGGGCIVGGTSGGCAGVAGG